MDSKFRFEFSRCPRASLRVRANAIAWEQHRRKWPLLTASPWERVRLFFCFILCQVEWPRGRDYRNLIVLSRRIFCLPHLFFTCAAWPTPIPSSRVHRCRRRARLYRAHRVRDRGLGRFRRPHQPGRDLLPELAGAGALHDARLSARALHALRVRRARARSRRVLHSAAAAGGWPIFACILSMRICACFFLRGLV